jgi:hypothetical protein
MEKERGVPYAKTDATAQKELKRAIEQGQTRSWQFSWYVDMKTGIVVRHEIHSVIDAPKRPHESWKHVTVFQMLDA